MVLKKIFLNGFLLGLLIILPVSGFGVDTSPMTEPVTVDNIKTGNYYIDIASPGWQQNNNGSSTNSQKLFINDFGIINQINPSNTGNSTGSPNDPSFDNNYIVDERYPVSSVPEPSTLLLLGLGALGLAIYRRKH